MNSNEIRQKFFKFFQDKNHELVKSAPVVPQDDPTILFTNAGMNQFKDIFLGSGTRDYVRAVDTQKCIRVSGKHNDLEEVGYDTYHHTFFEMLGNWSFGDYFKEEAIVWAWEFLTQIMELSSNKLYATVFGGDKKLELEKDMETWKFWNNNTPLSSSKIIFCGAKDNFWEMGSTGPCGPCTEIHYDRGPEACEKQNIKEHKCKVNGDCSRYIEIWNLVFMQYNKDENNRITRLKENHVDTGMGLERLAAIANGKFSNYDTDLFQPIFRQIETVSNKNYNDSNEIAVAFRVIADHCKTLSIAIADGVMPANAGRGYVLRRLLRRAVRYGRQFLDLDKPFMSQTVDAVIKLYGSIFPELNQSKAHIKQVLLSEEKAFIRTIDNGIMQFTRLINSLDGNVLDGEEAFDLYSTYGFPRDLIELMAREKGLTLDEKGWKKAEIEHIKASKSETRKIVDFDTEALGELSETIFTGYPQNHFYAFEEARISTTPLLFLKNNTILVLESTPFYAESGGQIGDSGIIFSGSDDPEKADFLFKVQNTTKFGNYHLHHGQLVKGKKLPKKVIASIDYSKRINIMANHSSTHLLHKALHEVLGEHARQQGSSVDDEKLRFDFTNSQKVNSKDLLKIEKLVNEKILQNLKVDTKIMDVEEAKKSVATAIFGEKYDNQVRVVSIGDFSCELCGGTHIPTTAEIGSLYITDESALSAGVRRITAVTRMKAWEYGNYYRKLMEKNANKLNTVAWELETKIDNLLSENKNLKKLGKKVEQVELKEKKDELLISDKELNGITIITAHLPKYTRKQISGIVDMITSGTQQVAGLLTSGAKKGSVAIVVFRSKSLKAFHAGRFLIKVAPIIDGRGGGRDNFAQGGGKNIARVEELIHKSRELLIEELK
ncbi:MAG: alanine--tRNA ligase [Deltaproteobacteria bacterium]|jgi:alanyl-tRNA synthetase|nr:alanine--tRNA ligase [Deltaproteobacteria bacterium]